MRRKEFIKTCGFACIGGGFLTGILQSCSPSKMIPVRIDGSDLIIPIKHFISNNGKEIKYVIAKNDKLQYPVCIYRMDENTYSALLMRCTHKHVELQVFGNKLQCPAHGSEFENTGRVTHGPAEQNLRTCPVIIESNQLRISLK